MTLLTANSRTGRRLNNQNAIVFHRLAYKIAYNVVTTGYFKCGELGFVGNCTFVDQVRYKHRRTRRGSGAA